MIFSSFFCKSKRVFIIPIQKVGQQFLNLLGLLDLKN